MTFSLRRKRRITLPARITPRRTRASLLAACLFILASGASAQDRMPSRPLVVSPPTVKHAVASPGDVGAPTTAVFQDSGTTSSTIYLVAQPSEYSEDVIPTELPGPERLFERYSEREMFDR